VAHPSFPPPGGFAPEAGLSQIPLTSRILSRTDFWRGGGGLCSFLGVVRPKVPLLGLGGLRRT